MISPKSKIVVRKNILPTFLKKKKKINPYKNRVSANSHQINTTQHSQPTILFFSPAFTFFLFFLNYWASKQIKLTAIKSEGQISETWMPHFYSSQANPQRLLLKSPCAIIQDWLSTTQLFRLQRDQLQTSLVNCQHWRISVLNVPREHRFDY